MRRLLTLLCIAYVLVGVTHAQLREQSKPLDLARELRTPVSARVGGILGLDPSRLRLSHSYSLSYFSLAGQSFAQGVYLNTINYELSAPLQLRLQWGMAHAPLQSMGLNSLVRSGPFLSAAQLQYRPSSKFSLEVGFQALPPYWRPLDEEDTLRSGVPRP